jgi:16S rRNA (guanine966-N2)-methyltransferase
MSLRIIGGKYKGRVLKAPKGSATRPTLGMLRESVFNICQNEIAGARFLDLFAGSGAMGLEALSRGASHITLVENDRHALASIRENIAALQAASQTTLIAGQAKRALKRLTSPFDIIYIDPPYDMPILPFIEELLARNLIEQSGILFIEERSGIHAPISLDVPELSKISSRRFGEALLHQYRFSAKKEP